jgi:hypothetical protein
MKKNGKCSICDGVDGIWNPKSVSDKFTRRFQRGEGIGEVACYCVGPTRVYARSYFHWVSIRFSNSNDHLLEVRRVLSLFSPLHLILNLPSIVYLRTPRHWRRHNCRYLASYNTFPGFLKFWVPLISVGTALSILFVEIRIALGFSLNL